MFAPIFNQTAQKYPLKALFVKVNTEALPNLGARFQIRSIPTLVVFKSGLEKKRNSGALDPLRLTSFINEFI
jgi:thioredoxin 2